MDFSSPPPFHEELMLGDVLFWDFHFDPISTNTFHISSPSSSNPLPVLPRSAFTRYIGPLADSSGCKMSQRRRNIHHRVIELVRSIPMVRDQPESQTVERSRGFRHMMRERQRRERLSQSYADLYSMLPYRSKPDKNSIVQSAAAYVRELKGVKEELQRRNEELRARNAWGLNSEWARIKIRAANPTCTIDLMIGALQRLKAMDVKARAIQAEFSGHELTAIMSIEAKVGASEVERALMESCRVRGEDQFNAPVVLGRTSN